MSLIRSILLRRIYSSNVAVQLGLRRFAPFSLPPRAINDRKAKRHPACAGAVFSHVADPYESKLSTDRRHTKKAQSFDCAFAFGRDPVGVKNLR